MDHNTDPFTQAQEATVLRGKLFDAAKSAVIYGHVDRDWVNQQLNRLGAPMITGQTVYKIKQRINGSYGTTITANNRAEALEAFNKYMTGILADGEVRSKSFGQGVYDVTATGEEPVFFYGPEDIEPDDSALMLPLDQLKVGIRQMLMDGVAAHGWGYDYARSTADNMGLPELPSLKAKTVQVPVTGVAYTEVTYFDGDDDDAIQRNTAAAMAKLDRVSVKPDEIGEAIWSRPDPLKSDAGFTLVDDDED